MAKYSPFALTPETELSLQRVARRLGRSEGATLDAAVRVLEDIVIKGELELRETSPVSGSTAKRPLSGRR